MKLLDEQYDDLLEHVRRGGFPVLTGVTLTKAQAQEVKDVMIKFYGLQVNTEGKLVGGHTRDLFLVEHYINVELPLRTEKL